MAEASEQKQNGSGATVRLNISGMTQAIALAAVLGAGSYIWVSLQKVPDPDIIKAVQVDLLQAKLESVRTQGAIAALDADITDIKAHLAEIERLVRMRNASRGDPAQERNDR